MAIRQDESWGQYQRRMLAETEQFIEFGLRHPELVNWIPAKPIGRGGFPRAVADWFYSTVLSASPTQHAATWRQRLREHVDSLRHRR